MQQGDLIAQRFEIEHLAGTGGMGAVYRARDRLDGSPVAVKVLQMQAGTGTARFAREVQVLGELRHPAIVRYISHGTMNTGDPFLVMEWLEGEDLAERLARGGLTIAETLVVMRRAAEGIAVAHGRGVVHRDIKPSNLYLPGRDVERLKVLDFGIARITDGARSVTKTGLMVGTLGYMAPEQARGARAIDARADVFSLGCVFFECLTGKPAFDSERVLSLLAKILVEGAPRVSDLRPDVPEALDDLVWRMLAKEPESRPADAAAVLAEIAGLESHGTFERTHTSAPPLALTGAEQRVLSVVLAEHAAGDTQADVPLATVATELEDMDRELRAMREQLVPFGATLERLADGSLVATVMANGAATDQAAAAARCALSLRGFMPDAPMALATGWGAVTGRWPVGEVLDRAAALLGGVSGTTDPEHPIAIDRARAIRVDQVTAGLLDSRFDVGGDASGLELRGEREVLETTRTLLGRETPFVGRDQELALLLGIFEEAVSDSVPRAAVVIAPAGVGKSRVRFEFLKRVKQRGAAVQIWPSRGDPMSAGAPFGMLGQALRRVSGIVADEPLVVRQQKLRARVGRHVAAAEVQRVTEFLGEMIGSPFADEHSVQLRTARRDAMLMGDQLRRAWEDLLAAECAAQPIVLVLEDLHWGDLASVKFVDAALQGLRDTPLMVLALTRPEALESFPKPWAAGGAVTELTLGPLSRKASERLVRDVLGEAATAETLARLVDHASGNAFYLEELMRAAVEGRGDALPGTVLAMAQARLEVLHVDARKVLRAASVFGRVFWEGGVRQLLGAADGASRVGDWLSELTEREVLSRRGDSRFANETEYMFRHALLREAAYLALTESDRALGHRLAAEWLTVAGETNGVTIAEHFERSGQPERAVALYRRAAEQALEGNDFSAGLSLAERGLRSGAHGEMSGALKLLQSETYRWRGDPQRSAPFATAAIAELGKGTPLWYMAIYEASMAAGLVRDREALIRCATELFETTAQGETRNHELVTLCRLTSLLIHASEIDLADKVLERIREVSTAIGVLEPMIAGRVCEARAHRALLAGDLESHLSLFESALAFFDQCGDVRTSSIGRISAAYAYMMIGDLQTAESGLRDALPKLERMGLLSHVALVRHNLGLILALTGRVAEGKALELLALERYVGQGAVRLEGATRIYLAQILVMDKDLEGAEREARRACEILAEIPTVRLLALATLAHVQLARGADAPALETAKTAMELLETTRLVEEGESLARLAYAEALHRSGDLAAARAAIVIARDRIQSHADRILDGRLRKGFVEGIAENARILALAREWLDAG